MLLWKIRPQDELSLDRYEGYPNFYRKEMLEVELNGKSVNAMVYIMNDGREFGAPSDFYLHTIAEGYGYCRYASYVPNISALTSPALQHLNERMTAAADYIVTTGTQNTTEGNWIIGFDELAQQTGFEHDFNSMDTLLDMLHEHEEVANVELGVAGAVLYVMVAYLLKEVPVLRKWDTTCFQNANNKSIDMRYNIIYNKNII